VKIAEEQLKSLLPDNPRALSTWQLLRRGLDQRFRVIGQKIGQVGDKRLYEESWATYMGYEPEWRAWEDSAAAAGPQEYRATIKKGATLLELIEAKLAKGIAAADTSVATRVDVDALASKVASTVEDSVLKAGAGLTALTTKMEEALREFVDVKRETLLIGSFAKHLGSQLRNARRAEFAFLVAAVLCLVGIPAAHLFLTNSHQASIVAGPGEAKALAEQVERLKSVDGYLLRGALTISLGALAYLFFGQYKVYRLESFRCSHLIGFVSGGARELEGLVTTDADGGGLREELNHRLVDAFLNIDEVSGAVRKARFPTSEVASQVREARRLLVALRDFRDRPDRR
jgi:hypothetical protein